MTPAWHKSIVEGPAIGRPTLWPQLAFIIGARAVRTSCGSYDSALEGSKYGMFVSFQRSPSSVKTRFPSCQVQRYSVQETLPSAGDPLQRLRLCFAGDSLRRRPCPWRTRLARATMWTAHRDTSEQCGWRGARATGPRLPIELRRHPTVVAGVPMCACYMHVRHALIGHILPVRRRLWLR